MEHDPQVLELVRDAVFNRDMKLVRFLISNKAAEQLQTVGVSTLPEIEYVLLHEVMPFCDKELNYVPKPFLGAGDVLVSYFFLCKETDLHGAVQFLRSLRGTLRVEAMRDMSVVWLSRKPRTGIPEPLMEVVREVSTTGSDLERRVAEWLIQGQEEKDEEPRDFREELFKYIRSEGTPHSGEEGPAGTGGASLL
jgi:hypothetical protein